MRYGQPLLQNKPCQGDHNPEEKKKLFIFLFAYLISTSLQQSVSLATKKNRNCGLIFESSMGMLSNDSGAIYNLTVVIRNI